MPDPAQAPVAQPFCSRCRTGRPRGGAEAGPARPPGGPAARPGAAAQRHHVRGDQAEQHQVEGARGRAWRGPARRPAPAGRPPAPPARGGGRTGGPPGRPARSARGSVRPVRPARSASRPGRAAGRRGDEQEGRGRRQGGAEMADRIAVRVEPVTFEPAPYRRTIQAELAEPVPMSEGRDRGDDADATHERPRWTDAPTSACALAPPSPAWLDPRVVLSPPAPVESLEGSGQSRGPRPV